MKTFFLNIQFESCKFLLILTPQDNTGADIIMLRKISLKFKTLNYAIKILLDAVLTQLSHEYHCNRISSCCYNCPWGVVHSSTKPSRGQSLPRSVKYINNSDVFICYVN